MKVVVAVLMGLISGFLIYMMGAMLAVDLSSSQAPAPAFVALLFLGGWALSTWLLLRGARTLSAVFRRGFLLGAAEWLLMAAIGVIFSGRAVGSTISQTGGSDAAAAGAAIGGGMMAAITGGVSVFMAVVCLIGFAIAYFTGREMSDRTSTPTRKCPECAEMIQPDARKCRFCGVVLSPEPARS
ncbi:MAG: zinc ribbon domain-containing protein [Gammaproteobacteria bacterium]|nr:zinc ribbon domain-containing protein [Gammaproteobacteria bacterium]